ncbi:hypothetical protein SHI21_08925 [Bacteriovorax sp. PP10]|uniref:Uncharacterized protein n=1 Tax=Bacteriovorax antarcticus TaxID=3088717 RepID=A0ABU5VTE4_9BACT|nr:hypothetical protein [Bacteriovorax sp. PP10]MEA9356323.1 hypothetical protein [Bacteriovorax sp. PP10]
MGSVKLFFSLLIDSFKAFKKEFPEYLGSYLAMLILNLVACYPFEGMGFEQNSFHEIVLQIIVGIMSLIVIVNVILIEKSKAKNLDKEELMYAAPTYLIYTLYSTLLILAGLFCFVVPGIIIAVLVGMVPLASVLIDNDSVNYFKISYRMARKDAVLVICFGLATLIMELPTFGLDLIPNWKVQLGASFVYSFFDSAVMVILTITSVRVFYHLKRALNDPS